MAEARHGMCELTRHGMETAWARHGMCELALKHATTPPFHTLTNSPFPDKPSSRRYTKSVDTKKYLTALNAPKTWAHDLRKKIKQPLQNPRRQKDEAQHAPY
jgi:hypothetical protein